MQNKPRRSTQMANHDIVSCGMILVVVTFLSIVGASNDTICGSFVMTRGYDCEEHTVTTEDGYILSVQRIPRGKSGKLATNPPVLLQHGLMMDGASWLVNPPNQSLALVLADNGYDVWIANSRGTKSSLNHTSFTPCDPRFWEWSWEELAIYDLPATVHYVRYMTKQNLHYIGHSLGSLMALVPLSENTKVVLENLRSVALFGPIPFLEHKSSFLGNFSRTFLSQQQDWREMHKFDPQSLEVDKLVKKICVDSGSDCSDLLTTVTGPNCCIDPDTIEKLHSHGLQSTSIKNMIHVSQLLVGKSVLTKFDYGEEENLKRYGTETPPAYNLRRAPPSVPLFVSVGERDLLSDPRGVARMLHDLKNHDSDKIVTLEMYGYAHADFVLSFTADELFQPSLLAFLEKF